MVRWRRARHTVTQLRISRKYPARGSAQRVNEVTRAWRVDALAYQYAADAERSWVASATHSHRAKRDVKREIGLVALT
jgi:hypothetical protein